VFAVAVCRIEVDRGADVADPDSRGLEAVAKSPFSVIAAPRAIGHRGLPAELVMRAAARSVTENQSFEFGRCLAEIGRGRSEARDGRRVDLRSVELLPFREQEGEAGSPQQRD